MKITEILKGKRILLWGYGLEGKSTEKFINKYCDVAELTVFQGKRESRVPVSSHGTSATNILP